jgi:serine protease AprX
VRTVAVARQRLRDRFGAAIEEKASDAFALFHGSLRPRRVRSSRVGSDATIVECRREPAGGVAAPLTPVLRRAAVAQLADRFRREAAAIVEAFATSSRVATAVPVEACWLNRSLRTWADLGTLADVASDERVRLIDRPRRLGLEIAVSVPRVGAPMYRATHHVDGAGVIVALIDSETADHPHLADRIVRKGNFTLEPWGTPDPHATAIAGIIGSASQTLTGVSPAITLYNYKVFPTLTPTTADDFSGTLALQQAVDDGAHIANCSWGLSDTETNGQSRLAAACDTAWNLGLVIVNSAGNKQALTVPADAEGVIAVGASDRRGTRVPPYSGGGPTQHGLRRPHLVAPGGTIEDQIISCVLSGAFGPCGYGTSFAAAHVSGLAALLLATHPTWTPGEVRADLMARSHSLVGVSRERQGAGLVCL